MIPSNEYIDTIEPTSKIRHIYDQGGLYIEVPAVVVGQTKYQKKRWRLRYKFNGKDSRKSLGTYPEVSLEEARGRRDSALRLLSEGINLNSKEKSEVNYCNELRKIIYNLPFAAKKNIVDLHKEKNRHNVEILTESLIKAFSGDKKGQKAFAKVMVEFLNHKGIKGVLFERIFEEFGCDEHKITLFVSIGIMLSDEWSSVKQSIKLSDAYNKKISGYLRNACKIIEKQNKNGVQFPSEAKSLSSLLKTAGYSGLSDLCRLNEPNDGLVCKLLLCLANQFEIKKYEHGIIDSLGSKKCPTRESKSGYFKAYRYYLELFGISSTPAIEKAMLIVGNLVCPKGMLPLTADDVRKSRKNCTSK